MIKAFREKLELIVKKISKIKFWALLKENLYLFSIFNWSENTIWIAVLFVISFFLTFIISVFELIEEKIKQEDIRRFIKIYFIFLLLFLVSKTLVSLRLKIREMIKAREVNRIETNSLK